MTVRLKRPECRGRRLYLTRPYATTMLEGLARRFSSTTHATIMNDDDSRHGITPEWDATSDKITTNTADEPATMEPKRPRMRSTTTTEPSGHRMPPIDG